MNQIEFFKATSAHVDLVVDMRMLFSNEYAGVQNPEVDAQLRKNLTDYFKRELNQNYLCWLATVNGEVASIAGMVIRINPGNVKNPSGIWGYIMSVYTKPKFRKMGLSKNLLDRLVETGKERGITAFELHATKDGANVYKKVGFNIFEEPTFRMYIS